MISGLVTNVLAGNVVTNSLLIVIAASAPNCWQNRSREDAGFTQKANAGASSAVQVTTFDRRRIV